MFNPYILLAVFLSVVGAAGGGYVKGKWDADRSAEVRELTEQRDGLKILLQSETAAREADAKTLAQNDAQLREYEVKAEDDAKKLNDGERVCFDRADRVHDLFRLPR